MPSMDRHGLQNGIGGRDEDDRDGLLEEKLERLVLAVKGGDLPIVKSTLLDMEVDEREQILLARLEDTYRVEFEEREYIGLGGRRRQREVYVRRPSLIMFAVTGFHPDTLAYLTSFQVGIEETCEVEDNGNSCHEYCGVRALHLACMAGKLRMVHALLSCGASPRKPTSLGDTPAHEAAYEGHPEIVKLLHEYGADLDIGNAREVTPLMVASYADSAGIIKYIVDAKSDLSKVDKDGRNAVFYAVVEGKLDTLLYLIDSGVPVKPDHHRVTIFMEAVYHMKMEVVHYVLENHDLLNIDLHAVDRTGRNVLFYLSHHEDPSLLELLLHWDIALEPTNDGRSLLMSAALHNNHPLTLYLISNCYKLGLDINEKDNKGRNVHFYCITGGDVALLELLITHHVPVQASTDGVTILMQAVAKNKPDVIQYLIEKMDTGEIDDLDLNARDADGWDAIMYATASANMVVFEQLTQVGARCQSAGDGRNVIMQAASKGQLDFLKYLLHHSHDLHLDLHAEDLDGWNSLFYAVQGST